MKVFVSSVMWETWRERATCLKMLAAYGHIPILKANYENGPEERETSYHTEPTIDLIDRCDFFLMIPRFSYGLTTASGRSMAHEELFLAQRGRKIGMAFGPISERHVEANMSQKQLLQKLSAQLGPSFMTYDTPEEFERLLESVLSEGLEKFGIKLRTNLIFLAHSSNDKGFVERLEGELLRKGFDVWYDNFEIAIGDGLLETIRKGIVKSTYVALVLSPDSVKSSWVKTEIEMAFELEKYWGQKVLIPIKCKDFEWPHDLTHLSDLKYADFTGQWDIAIRELVASLRY